LSGSLDDRRLQHRPGPRGAEVRHRRRLFRRRLGYWRGLLFGYQEWKVRLSSSAGWYGATGPEIRLHPFLRRRGRAVDDLIAAGLCFNLFQPVMDIRSILEIPRRLSFWGGPMRRRCPSGRSRTSSASRPPRPGSAGAVFPVARRRGHAAANMLAFIEQPAQPGCGEELTTLVRKLSFVRTERPSPP
jgi:hypothetical protein